MKLRLRMPRRSAPPRPTPHPVSVARLPERQGFWQVFWGVFAFLYLMAASLLVLALLTDVWTDSYFGVKVILTWLGGAASLNGLQAALADGTFRLFFYAFCGGALGACLDGFRTWSLHFSDAQDLHPRYAGKYVAGPLVGGVLALVALGLARSTLGVLGAELKAESLTTTTQVTGFSLGALAGFGSRQVFLWLDSQVKRVFAPGKVIVPNLDGLNPEVATKKLKVQRLKAADDPAGSAARPTATVAKQDPLPGTEVEPHSFVKVTWVLK